GVAAAAPPARRIAAASATPRSSIAMTRLCAMTEAAIQYLFDLVRVLSFPREPGAVGVLRRRRRRGQRGTRRGPAQRFPAAAEPPDPRARGRAGGCVVRALAARRPVAAGG